MTHPVRGHYRNGRWVRPHTRRNTGRGVAVRQVSTSGPVARVRAHQRADGTSVRSHYRRLPATTATGLGIGTCLFLLAVGCVLVLLLDHATPASKPANCRSARPSATANSQTSRSSHRHAGPTPPARPHC